MLFLWRQLQSEAQPWVGSLSVTLLEGMVHVFVFFLKDGLRSISYNIRSKEALLIYFRQFVYVTKKAKSRNVDGGMLICFPATQSRKNHSETIISNAVWPIA